MKTMMSMMRGECVKMSMSSSLLAAYKMKETIHSGHFMVSDIDDSEVAEDEDTVSVPVLDAEDRAEVVPERAAAPFDFDSACKETSDTYTFGPTSAKSISIDGTLTKLFQCMTIAYSGKLTSPRWKNFKGLKLRWKDKIRLNNVIWRAWHMQFVKRKSPIVCQFASPLDGDTHNKPEAVVLEGKYWKRRLDTVCAEYKKWRLFYKEKTDRSRAMSDAGFDFDLFNWQPRSNQSFHSSTSMIIDEDPFSDFNDTLFSCLLPNQPFAFPNPREIARAGLADFIQPGLVQLQPNLEGTTWDFMDTFDIFSAARNSDQAEENSLQDILNNHSQPPPPPPQDCFNVPMMPQAANDESANFSAPKSFRVNSALASYAVDDNDFMDTTTIASVESNEPKINRALSNALVPLTNMPELPLGTESPPLLDQQLCPGLSPQTDSSSLESPPQPSYSPVASLFVGQQPPPASSVVMTPKGGQNKYVNILPAPQTAFPKQNVLQQLVQPTPAPAVYMRTSVPNVKEPKPSRKSVANQSKNQTDITNAQKQDVFIMPKSTARMRARSMSGPQISTPNNFTMCPAGNADPTLSTTTNVLTQVAPILPQNALLAQLLTTGTYLQNSKEDLPATGAVTIISTAAPIAETTKTVVISPVPLNSVNSMVPNPEMLATRNKSLPSLSVTSIDNITSADGSGVTKFTANCHALLENRISPPKPFRPKSDTERVQYREHRRVCHINAEQKRRCNIKTGFDTLHMLVPSLSQNPNAKVSKAAMLQKAGEYIVQLRTERAQCQEEADQLRKQIDNLNQAISVCQSQLPATGAPVSRQRTSKLKEMFEEYVRKRTLQNWKFWIFSILIQPLLDTYNNSVSTANLREMCRTILAWVEQHCSLVALRPAVLNALRHLSTSTNILTDPTNIAEEAALAVTKTVRRPE